MLVVSLTKGLIPKVFHEHIAHMGEYEAQANASGKVMVPNIPNWKCILCSPHQKRETKVPEGTKVVWLRKTTNQRLAITEDSAAIS
ncbi:hypothetical protein CR513_14361, partial [Mucuna pruriens]